VVAKARERGVLVTAWSNTRVRAVTHLDADRAAVTRAAGAVREAIESSAR